VHETRKTIKRMRALARLLRYELGEQEFKRVNDSLRTAGQRLSGARDAEVRLATMRRLRARSPEALVGVEPLAARLERERDRASQPAPPSDVVEDIAEMRRELARWNLVEHDFQALAPGLARIYGEGRRRHARVKREHARNPEHLHDWRKRVKALYYALDMLGCSGTGGGTSKAARRANRLGELLGEEHDLWMLRAYVELHAAAFGEDTAAYRKLLKQIERRQARLRKRALKLGARLYKRKPRDFTRRVASSLSE
jgi:CHAD domain-containing protein